MRRHIIGVLAIALLCGGVAFQIWPLGTEGWQVQLEAACWRVGLLLAAVWLAYHQVERMPAWIWAALPVLVIVLAKWPKWFFIALPVVVVLGILKRLGRTAV